MFFGTERGCRLSTLLINPSRRLPLEKATLANLAVVQCILEEKPVMISSINFFVAPMMFTGLAALSVETQKKRDGLSLSTQLSKSCAYNRLFSTIASIEKISFSLRTCLCAAKFAMISNGLYAS